LRRKLADAGPLAMNMLFLTPGKDREI